MVYSEHQETIDNIRVSATKSSPMMETVQLCVPQVGPEELPSLVPRLVEVMKSGVGLATKVASAQFVVLLVHHCLNDLTPFAGEGGSKRGREGGREQAREGGGREGASEGGRGE